MLVAKKDEYIWYMAMFILSIGTATDMGTVALHEQTQLLGTSEYHVDRAHNEVLPQTIKALLSSHHMGVADLGAIAIMSGPGSYTGLRMGTALAKGLCFASNIPLIPIDTLEVLLAQAASWDLSQEGIRYGLLDARRGYGYGRTVGSSGQLLRETHVCEVTLATFQPWLNKGKVYLLGNGADHYADVLEGAEGLVIAKGLYPRAADMGPLAYDLLMKGKRVDLERFTPHYLSALTYRAAMQKKTNPA
ncbi:MAG: tRNA (adenosine(37)-N6)-threonylcarbamoyltransferase complex dimerization subunit type 1 TsaB [Bacteroidota bacterium]